MSFLNSGLRANKNMGGITTVVEGLMSSSKTGAILLMNRLKD